MRARIWSLVFGVGLLGACAGDEAPVGDGGATGGNSGNGGGAAGAGGAAGGSGGAGMDAGAGSDRVVSWDGSGPSCGAVTVPVEYKPVTPDVLIVFDRSGSMNDKFGGGTRYTAERDALTELVTMYENKIRFGYEEFPLKESCGKDCCQAGKVIVPPALANAKAVNDAINNAMPNGRTPTPSAIRNAREFYATFKDGITDRFVLLSTDGKPNCSFEAKPIGEPEACDLLVPEVSKLLAENGVRTIALGVADDGTLGMCLERVGAMGGAPRPGAPPSYFPAADAAALKKALTDIIGSIAVPTCSMDLTSPPPDPNKLVIVFDGMIVPWDPSHVNGWDYAVGSTTRINLYGSYCTALSGGKVGKIEAKFGCPDDGLPPPPPSCPAGVTPCGPGGVEPGSCPAGTVCRDGCCLPWVP